jgi:hypothetical protein
MAAIASYGEVSPTGALVKFRGSSSSSNIGTTAASPSSPSRGGSGNAQRRIASMAARRPSDGDSGSAAVRVVARRKRADIGKRARDDWRRKVRMGARARAPGIAKAGAGCISDGAERPAALSAAGVNACSSVSEFQERSVERISCFGDP